MTDDEALQAWWEQHRERLLDEATPEVSVPEAEALDEVPRPLDQPPLEPWCCGSAPMPV